MAKLYKLRTHYILTPYYEGENETLEKYLSAFVKYFKVRGGYFNPIGFVIDNGSMFIPAGVNQTILERMVRTKAILDTSYMPYDEIYIRSTATPKDEVQSKMIRFLLGEGEYYENKNYSQLCCNAQTGEGKTFAAIMMMVYYQCKALVIVHTHELALSWDAQVQQHGNIDKTKILLLNPTMIRSIINDELDVSGYYFFIIIHRSIMIVAEDLGWESITVLFSKLRIGLKIIDEANQEFHNIIHIDAYTNVYKNIYLTATMKRSDKSENIVFQRCFAAIPKFNTLSLGFASAKKHIHMIALLYNSNPSIGEVAACRSRGMFDVKKYADYQVYSDDRLFELLTTVIEKFTIGRNFRTIIFCAKINSCEIIADYLKSVFPEKTIGIFNSSISKHDKKRVISKSSIIVSTTKSLGMGVNINNLRMAINIEAFRFDGTGDQAAGRLRKWFSDTESWYVELVDIGFKTIRSQYQDRLKLYEKLFASIDEIKC